MESSTYSLLVSGLVTSFRNVKQATFFVVLDSIRIRKMIDMRLILKTLFKDLFSI